MFTPMNCLLLSMFDFSDVNEIQGMPSRGAPILHAEPILQALWRFAYIVF